jgi:hypothetical protein
LSINEHFFMEYKSFAKSRWFASAYDFRHAI